MTALKNKAMKVEFLKGLQAGQYSIKDLEKEEIHVVFDNEGGGYICYETGQLFTEDDRQKGIADCSWIEL